MKVVKYVLMSLLAILCIMLEGCATAGSIAPEIISQSAAVDTDISELQGQQATTAETASLVSATTDALEQTAKDIGNDKLAGQVVTLKTQIKTLTDSLKTERKKTTQIQSDYSALKVSSGTELVNQSSKIIKQAQQIKMRNKWIAILAVIIFIHLLLDAAVLMLKFYFHKI